MSHVSNKELSCVLRAIAVLNSGTGMDTLRERTLGCVTRLIPNSTMTAFDGLDPEGEYDGSLWYTPPETVPLERIQILTELLHEHPFCDKFFLTNNESVYRLSDGLRLPEFHRTALYNEFYRLFDGEAQLASVFRLSANSLIAFSFHRPKLDFSDSEVEMLRLVTPHVKAAFRNAREFERLENQGRYLSSATTRGVVVLGPDGELAFINEIARKNFNEYFDQPRNNGLPEPVERYVLDEGAKFSEAEYRRPPEPFIVRREASVLAINLSFNTETNELMLLLEEKRESSKDDFGKLGLSKRETEVLYWMSRGKADREIAILCDISHRTVEKHAEHVYTKLGVENRLSAILRAVDILEDR